VPVLDITPVAAVKLVFVGNDPDTKEYETVAPASGSVATKVAILAGYEALELS